VGGEKEGRRAVIAVLCCCRVRVAAIDVNAYKMSQASYLLAMERSNAAISRASTVSSCSSPYAFPYTAAADV